ncbi:MAG: hypothetical protein OEW77_04445 [Gemmatimonadota bacterium]|nr:hypothetical protein [Gemmatimonadota bacterium]
MADLPAPTLPRAALERVLLRAAELQMANAEKPETLTETDLIALAEEVGISPLAVRQALAEERMRVAQPEERGLIASLAGPASFAASRIVPGNAKEILDRIDRSFQRDENLAERRRFPDRIVWGARGGFAGAVRELTRLDGRGFPLVKADEVSATVIQVEPGRVHARVETTLTRRRAVAVRNGTLGTVAGFALTNVLLVLGVFAPLTVVAGAALALGSLWLVRRNYRRDAAKAHLAIEQSLDRIEFGQPRKGGLLDQLLLNDRS